MIGTAELVVVAGIVVLLFGASKIPELARGLGRAKREFIEAAKSDSRNGSEE
jgi:sec-independent protein translocase protein TatA